MSNFTPKVKFVTEFDGDTVSMNLSRLKRKHVAIISPFMKGIDIDGNAVVEFSSQLEFSEAMVDVLPECVTDFTGLFMTDGDGNAVPMTLDDVIDETYFSGLIGSIMSELFSISKPKEAEVVEVKKSSSDTAVASPLLEEMG